MIILRLVLPVNIASEMRRLSVTDQQKNKFHKPIKITARFLWKKKIWQMVFAQQQKMSESLLLTMSYWYAQQLPKFSRVRVYQLQIIIMKNLESGEKHHWMLFSTVLNDFLETPRISCYG